MQAGVGTVGRPFLREGKHLFFEGFLVGIVEVVDLFHGHLDAVVVDGKDVFAAKGEHEEHFYRPAADTLDLGEQVDDLLVAHLL